MHCCLAKAGVVTEHAVELRPNEQRGREVNRIECAKLNGGDEAGLIVRTHRASDAALRTTVEQLSSLNTVRQVLGVMRVEGEAGA